MAHEVKFSFVGYRLIAYIALATVVINALEVAIVMVFSFNAVSTSPEKLFGMTKALSLPVGVPNTGLLERDVDAE